MPKSVFYSFHYEEDVHRVQLVRQLGVLKGQPLLNAQSWEAVRARGDQAIKKWIDQEMAYKKAVIVLVGRQTAYRPWVQYEIEKAWKEKRPLLGIRIHGLSSMGQADSAGPNPFVRTLGIHSIHLFDPTCPDIRGGIDTKATYNSLHQMLPYWAEAGATRW